MTYEVAPAAHLGLYATAWRDYVRLFKPIATIIAVSWAPMVLLSDAIELFVLGHTARGGGPLELLQLLANAVATAAVVHLMVGERTDSPISWREALAFGLGHWWPMLATLLVAALAVLLGTLALIVPGFFLAVRFSLALSVAAAEGERGMVGDEALRRSMQLTRGRFWRTAGLLVGSTAMILIINAAVGLLIETLPPSPLQWALLDFAEVLAQIIGAYATVLFYCAYAVYAWEDEVRPAPAQADQPPVTEGP